MSPAGDAQRWLDCDAARPHLSGTPTVPLVAAQCGRDTGVAGEEGRGAVGNHRTWVPGGESGRTDRASMEADAE